MLKHFSHFTYNLKFTVKINYGKDAKNKWDFSLSLNFCREFDDITSAGKLFHVRAAATGNARSSTVDCLVGYVMSGNYDVNLFQADVAAHVFASGDFSLLLYTNLNITRNTLDWDHSNVYSSRVIFSSISPNLPFCSLSLYRRSASYPPLRNKCPISCHMCQQSL